MKEIVASNGQKILVDDVHYEIAKKYKWKLGNSEKSKYPVTIIKGCSMTFSKVVFGIEDGQAIYHKNKNPFDYTQDNIILCSRELFGYLTWEGRTKASKYSGVLKKSKCWAMRMKKDDGKVYEENYHREEDAALAADYFAILKFGEYARRNFPDITNEELEERYKLLRKRVKEETKSMRRKAFQGLAKGDTSSRSSKYVGVQWNKEKNKWESNVTFCGKVYRLGRFDNELDAAIAYDMKTVELHGTGSKRNFTEMPVDDLTWRYNEIVKEKNRLTLTEKLSTINQGKPKPQFNCKSSRYVGVTKRGNSKWIAQITHMYKHIYIGIFDSEEDAARAYDQKALQLFGENSKLNFKR